MLVRHKPARSLANARQSSSSSSVRTGFKPAGPPFESGRAHWKVHMLARSP
jgi:hypothetical protein